jgi:hypothetical protein
MADRERQDTWHSETVIAALLRGGVILAGAVVAVGAAVYLFHYGLTLPDYRVFRGEPSDLRSVRGIISDATTLAAAASSNSGCSF